MGSDSGIRAAVRRHVERIPDLAGRTVVDVPAGDGYMSRVLLGRGAVVIPLDLFPAGFHAPGLVCRQADLLQPLPLPDAAADFVLCQEGIEHLPDQLAPLREFARVLKPEGRLLLSTPSVSNVRARLSHLLLESELYHRLPSAPTRAVRAVEDGRCYFGHIFLIGVQRLRILAGIAGLRIERILPAGFSLGSLLAGVPLLPLLAATSGLAYVATVRHEQRKGRAMDRRVYGGIAALNLHPRVLFGKHLFVEFARTRS